MFTFLQNSSLKPANEVWGKVIISEASVILFTKGGVYLPGGGPAYRRGLYPWGSVSKGGMGRPAGSALGGGIWQTPPELEKWAVRILLECFLVF